MQHVIRLMTYNIRGGLGIDGRRSTRRIAEVVRESGAQVVCVQEVHQRLPWSRMIDQPGRLHKALGMTVLFQRNLSIGVGGYGSALVTSLEISQTTMHPLTSRREQRGAIEARLDTPDGPLTVFCTHLGLDSEERVGQARELAALLNACETPKLICGDFNEEADGAAVELLVESTGLVDAGVGGAPTFSSDNPVHRIDMIFCDPSIRVSNIRVLDTMASDHKPLVADLELDQTSGTPIPSM